jgi:hypothetical protein
LGLEDLSGLVTFMLLGFGMLSVQVQKGVGSFVLSYK